MSLKPLYLTRGFSTFCSCQWLYFGTVSSFLSVSGTRTWELMVLCLLHGWFLGVLRYLIIKDILVEISQNLLLDFWHKTFWEPRTFPRTRFCPGLRKCYISAPSVSNFSPVNSLFLSILVILPVCLIMWEVLESRWLKIKI